MYVVYPLKGLLQKQDKTFDYQLNSGNQFKVS